MSSYFNDDQLDAWRSQDKLLAEIKQLREQLAAANERAEKTESRNADLSAQVDRLRELLSGTPHLHAGMSAAARSMGATSLKIEGKTFQRHADLDAQIEEALTATPPTGVLDALRALEKANDALVRGKTTEAHAYVVSALNNPAIKALMAAKGLHDAE